MSRYADKKVRPGCLATDCPRPAIALAVVRGVLGWYCEEHRNK